MNHKIPTVLFCFFTPIISACGIDQDINQKSDLYLESHINHIEATRTEDPELLKAFGNYIKEASHLDAEPKIIENYGRFGNAYVARFEGSSMPIVGRDTIRGTRFVSNDFFNTIMVFDGQSLHNLKDAYVHLILTYDDLKIIDSLQRQEVTDYASLYETCYPIDVDKGYEAFQGSGKEIHGEKPLFLEKKTTWDGTISGDAITITIDRSFSSHQFQEKDFGNFEFASFSRLTSPSNEDGAKKADAQEPARESFNARYKVSLKNKNDLSPFIRHAEKLDYVKSALPSSL